MSELPMYRANDSFRPFSNGHEHRHWLNINCHRGERGCRNYNPLASSSKNGCPIEVAVAVGSVDTGEIPARIGLRGGWLEPGPNGMLVEVHAVGSDGYGGRLIPECPEYRGYDEPDDRPRRGPRPPAHQLDLLDPRNVPDRERVVP